jgi:hypothetical protein
MSRDRTYLGSCSHDSTVKFWNIRYLYEKDEAEEAEAAAEGEEQESVARVAS